MFPSIPYYTSQAAPSKSTCYCKAQAGPLSDLGKCPTWHLPCLLARALADIKSSTSI